MSRVELIREKLTAALKPTMLEISDDSGHHRGHPGAANGAGHYTVKIAAPVFAGRSKITCHQLVYAALAEMLPSEIHALQIKIIYP